MGVIYNATTPTLVAQSISGLMQVDQNGNLMISGNTDNAIFPSATYTSTQVSSDQLNFVGRGAKVVLDVTSIPGGNLTLAIKGKDLTSGKYYTILTGGTVSTVSTNLYTVFPGLTPIANTTVSDVLPRTYQVTVNPSTTSLIAYSVGVCEVI